MNPHNLGVGVAFEGWLNAAEWEGSDLFYTHNCDISNSELGSLSLEVVVNLTTAVDNFANLTVGDEVCRWVIEHTLESQTGLKVIHT